MATIWVADRFRKKEPKKATKQKQEQPEAKPDAEKSEVTK
jgi:hypothetical protein